MCLSRKIVDFSLFLLLFSSLTEQAYATQNSRSSIKQDFINLLSKPRKYFSHKTTEDFRDKFLSFEINKTLKGYDVNFNAKIFRKDTFQNQEIRFIDEDTKSLVLTFIITPENVLRFNVLSSSPFSFKDLTINKAQGLEAVAIHSSGRIKLIDSLLSIKKLIVESPDLKIKSKKGGSLYADNITIDSHRISFNSENISGENLHLTLKGFHNPSTVLEGLDNLSGIKNLHLFMPETDFFNKKSISLNHLFLSAHFRSIINQEALISQGQLFLESFSDFSNDGKSAEIRAQYGLLTKASRIHTNSGHLSGGERENVISASVILSNNGFYEGNNIIQNATKKITHQSVSINALHDIHLIADQDIQFLVLEDHKDLENKRASFQRNILQAKGQLIVEAGNLFTAQFSEVSLSGNIFIKGLWGVDLQSYLSSYKVYTHTQMLGQVERVEQDQRGSQDEADRFSTVLKTDNNIYLMSPYGVIKTQGVNLEAEKDVILTSLKGILLESLKIMLSKEIKTTKKGFFTDAVEVETSIKEAYLSPYITAKGNISLISEGIIDGDNVTIESLNNLMIFGRKGVNFTAQVQKEEKHITNKEGLGPQGAVSVLKGVGLAGVLFPPLLLVAPVVAVTSVGVAALASDSESSSHNTEGKVTLSFLRAKNDLQLLSDEGSVVIQGTFKESKNLILSGQEVHLSGMVIPTHFSKIDKKLGGLIETSTSTDKSVLETLKIKTQDKAEYKASQGPVNSTDLEMRVDNLSIYSPQDIHFSSSVLGETTTTQNQGISFNIFGVEVISPELREGWDRIKGINTNLQGGYQNRTIIKTSQHDNQSILQANHIQLETGKKGNISVKSINVTGRDQEKVKELTLNTQNLSIQGAVNKGTSTTKDWSIQVGYDLVTQTPTLGGDYKDEKTYTTTHRSTQFQVDSFVNKRKGTEVKFEGAIQADITESVGERLDVTIKHAQNKQGQEGYSVGGNIGLTNAGIHGSFKTGEKTSSKDTTTGRNLTDVKIGVESHIERTDRHYQDTDSRWGLEGGINGGINSFGIDVSGERGDDRISGGFSVGKNAEGKSKNSFHMGVDVQGVKFEVESDILNAPNGESALARGAQGVDKVLYGVQQIANSIESGNNIAKNNGKKGLYIIDKNISKVHHGLNIARQGAATVTKIGNTDWGKDISNKILIHISWNTCAHQGLEYLLGKPIEELTRDAKKGLNMDGATLSEIEALIQTQHQLGVIRNYCIQEIYGKGALMAHLNALGVNKASFVIYDSQEKRDHMIVLQKDKIHGWEAYDFENKKPISVDLSSLEYNKGSLLAVNTKVGNSSANYDRNRNVFVGAPSPKKPKVEANLSSPRSPRAPVVPSESESITTVSTASEQNSDSDSGEWYGPTPSSIHKNDRTRGSQYRQEFENNTGCKSAAEYAKKQGKNLTNPQIGHAQAHQNHGANADTRVNNLVVIERAGNLQMNKADGLYQPGQVDGNMFLVESETLIAIAANQNLRNPKNHNLFVTPSIITDTGTAFFSPEETSKQAARIKRALDTERINMIQRAQEENPNNFSTAEETHRKVKDRMKKDRKNEEWKGLDVYKFSDQSKKAKWRQDQKSSKHLV